MFDGGLGIPNLLFCYWASQHIPLNDWLFCDRTDTPVHLERVILKLYDLYSLLNGVPVPHALPPLITRIPLQYWKVAIKPIGYHDDRRDPLMVRQTSQTNGWTAGFPHVGPH